MGYKWLENPNAKQGWENLENYAGSQDIGASGRLNKKLLKRLWSGDFSGIAGSLLSPIGDRFRTNLREGLRANMMGANAFAQQDNPAFYAALESDMRLKSAEGEGLAYSEAIPQLWNSASNNFQQAYDSKNQRQLSALSAGMQARLNSGQYVKTPGFLDKLGQIVGIAGGVAGMAAGIPGLSSIFSRGASPGSQSINTGGPTGYTPGQYPGGGYYS